ncbi:hypothetical protein [Streptomyces sp. NPDC058678]|uniref:hypothetical protein n=1 Tax=Streptomyces sp. NPDC058678 TaxID=3346595 RepID=UPI003664E00B
MTRTRLLFRIEPHDGTDLEGALAAGVWDPLWMLARQDAMGELLGTFGGAPITAAARGVSRALTHFRPGLPPGGWPGVADPGTVLLDGDAPPVAVLAEAQPVRSIAGWPLRDRAAAGVRLADELEAEGVPDVLPGLVATYPIGKEPAEDAASRELYHVMAGRLPDGEAMHADLVSLVRGSDPDWPLPARLARLGWDAPGVRAAARRWVDWLDATIQEPATVSSWDAGTLGYRYAVAAATNDPSLGTDILTADGPREELDWHAFDVAGRSPHAGNGAEPRTFATPDLVPVALRFPGMPTPRWWEMDDAAIDFGAVDASDADLARLLVLDYTLAYGNDMFVIPLRLPVDTLTTVEGLAVLDTFGVRTEITPAIETSDPAWAAWRMFTLTGDQAQRPSLLLFARLSSPVVAEPMDEGQLVRDEMANTAWLIESQYEGEDGFAVRRADSVVSDVAPPRPAPPDTPLQWTLSVTPAPHWIPYIPLSAADGTVSLTRAEGYEPRGQLLSAVPDTLPDRVVSREGVRMLRESVHARDSVRPYVWTRWRAQAGRGETSSGLAFDVMRPPESP